MARDVIRQAIAKVFKKYFKSVPLQSVVQWFELGGDVKVRTQRIVRGSFSNSSKRFRICWTRLKAWVLKAKDDPALLAAGGEFILEGLYALKRTQP